MQKKLIALAVAGLASTAAFAQSNVTIYGVADGSFDNVKVSDGVTANNNVNFNRVAANSSYIGFKGTEDLGNGMKAVFQYENGVNFDGASGTWANRDSFVGLSSNAGTIVLGTLTGPTRALGTTLDVNAGATGIGSNSALLGKLGNTLTGVATDANGTAAATACGRSSTCASIFDTRWKNAIAYVSPNFNGFSGVAAYVANENKVDGASAINTSGYDLGLNYANGPITAGLTYNDVKLRNDATALNLGTDIKTNDLRAGAMYNFGVATVRVIYDRVKAESSLVDVKQTVWGLGGTYNVTSAGQIIAQYYKANDVKDTDSTGAKLYEVGYVHSLSKRTTVRAVYARLNNDDGAKYDFGANATGLSSNGATLSGLSLGLRHNF